MLKTLVMPIDRGDIATFQNILNDKLQQNSFIPMPLTQLLFQAHQTLRRCRHCRPDQS